MSQYILAIDAGGTKTQGLLKCQDSGETWSLKLGPGSLSNNYSLASQNIINVAKALLVQGNCTATETVFVCGAAGVNNKQLKSKLEDELSSLNFLKIIITTDAQISLYGAGKGSPVIAIAIGTGSVAMRLDNSGCEKQFGGWGFTAGDQGSGAFIGRELVRSVLKEFDKDNFKADDFTSRVLNVIGQDRQSISNWLKNVTPAKFAELSPLVSNSRTSSAMANAILIKAAFEVEELISMTQVTDSLPVCLTGGLAEVLYPLLSEEIRAQIIPAKGDAVDGALFLGEIFLKEQELVEKALGEQPVA